MDIKILDVSNTKESALADYKLLCDFLGKEIATNLFEGLVMDFNHTGVWSLVGNHALLHRIAGRHGLQESLLDEYKAIYNAKVANNKYDELAERYMALMIAENELGDIKEALPEHKVLGDSNPDWTLRSFKSEFYVEVSAISRQKVAEELSGFGGRIPHSKLIKLSKEPIYFELVFNIPPRSSDPEAMSGVLCGLIKDGIFPVELTCDGIDVLVDTLKHRHQLPNILSDKLSDMDYLKSTCFIKDRLAYTLAVKVSLKSIEGKISEKKKSNRLDEIGNVWLCIFVDWQRLNDFAINFSLIGRLRKRVHQSGWLKGLFVAASYSDTEGKSELRYVKVG